MNNLTLRISNKDFSTFAGFDYTDGSYERNNEELNEYIELYKKTEKFKYLQIECDRNLSMHTIAYICHRVAEKYFIKIDFEPEKDNKYYLFFAKEDKQQ